MSFVEITTLVESLHQNNSIMSHDLETCLTNLHQALGQQQSAPGVVASVAALTRDPLDSLPQHMPTRAVAALFPAASAGVIGRAPAAAQLLATDQASSVPVVRVVLYALLTCKATADAKLRVGFWALDRHLHTSVRPRALLELMPEVCAAVRAATCLALQERNLPEEVQRVQLRSRAAFMDALAAGVVAAAIQSERADAITYSHFTRILTRASRHIFSLLSTSVRCKAAAKRGRRDASASGGSTGSSDGGAAGGADLSELRTLLCTFVKPSRLVDRFLEEHAATRSLGGSRSLEAHGSGLTGPSGSSNSAPGMGSGPALDPFGADPAGARIGPPGSWNQAPRSQRSLLHASTARSQASSVADFLQEGDNVEDGQIISSSRSIVLPQDSGTSAGLVNKRGHLAVSIPGAQQEVASPRTGPPSIASMSQVSTHSAPKERPRRHPFWSLFAQKNRGTSLPVVRDCGVALAQLQGQKIINKSSKMLLHRDGSRSPSPIRLTAAAVGSSSGRPPNSPPLSAEQRQQQRVEEFVGALASPGAPFLHRASTSTQGSGRPSHQASPPAMAPAPGLVRATVPPVGVLAHRRLESMDRSLSFTSRQTVVASGEPSRDPLSPRSPGDGARPTAPFWSGPTAAPGVAPARYASRPPSSESGRDDDPRSSEIPPSSVASLSEALPRAAAASNSQPREITDLPPGLPLADLLGELRFSSRDNLVRARLASDSPDSLPRALPGGVADKGGPAPRRDDAGSAFEIEPLTARELALHRGGAGAEVQAACETPRGATADASVPRPPSLVFPAPIPAADKVTPQPWPLASNGEISSDEVDGGVVVRISREDNDPDKLSIRSADLNDDTDIDTLVTQYTQALEDLKMTMMAEQSHPDVSPFAVISATMKFAGSIGGKLFILGSVRLILSITLIFFDAVVFLLLFDTANVTAVGSLGIVVAFNVFLALILLLVVTRSTRSSEGLAQLATAGQAHNANAIMDSIPLQFRPLVDNVMRHVRTIGEQQRGAAEAAAAPRGSAAEGRATNGAATSAGGEREDKGALADKLLDVAKQWTDKLPDKHKDLTVVKAIQSAVQELQDRQARRRTVSDGMASRFAQAAPTPGAVAPMYALELDAAQELTEGVRISKAAHGDSPPLAPTSSSKRSAAGGRMATVKRA